MCKIFTLFGNKGEHYGYATKTKLRYSAMLAYILKLKVGVGLSHQLFCWFALLIEKICAREAIAHQLSAVRFKLYWTAIGFLSYLDHEGFCTDLELFDSVACIAVGVVSHPNNQIQLENQQHKTRPTTIAVVLDAGTYHRSRNLKGAMRFQTCNIIPVYNMRSTEKYCNTRFKWNQCCPLVLLMLIKIVIELDCSQ